MDYKKIFMGLDIYDDRILSPNAELTTLRHIHLDLGLEDRLIEREGDGLS